MAMRGKGLLSMARLASSSTPFLGEKWEEGLPQTSGKGVKARAKAVSSSPTHFFGCLPHDSHMTSVSQDREDQHSDHRLCLIYPTDS